MTGRDDEQDPTAKKADDGKADPKDDKERGDDADYGEWLDVDDDGEDDDEDDEDENVEVEQRIRLVNAEGAETGLLDGETGHAVLGGAGVEGEFELLNAAGDRTVHLDGGEGKLTLGGSGARGDIALLNDGGAATVHLDGGGGNLSLGGAGAQGDLALLTADGTQTIHLDGGDGMIRVHGRALTTADHVFDPDHALTPLTELAAFVAARRHLPGVPSAAEMRRDGVDLGALSVALLAQVEELTLRLIEMDARLARLEAR